jgi:Ca2+-binding EF-hand superfamily protein
VALLPNPPTHAPHVALQVSSFEDDVRYFWDQADADQDGTLSKLEIFKWVKSGACDIAALRGKSFEVVSRALAAEARDPSKISYKEFKAAVQRLMPSESKQLFQTLEALEKDLRTAWYKYDKDRNGVLSAREVFALFKNKEDLPEPLRNASLTQLQRVLDRNGDQQVTRGEFREAMLRLLPDAKPDAPLGNWWDVPQREPKPSPRRAGGSTPSSSSRRSKNRMY